MIKSSLFPLRLNHFITFCPGFVKGVFVWFLRKKAESITNVMTLFPAKSVS